MASEGKRVGRPTKPADPGTRVSLGLKVTGATKLKLETMARESGLTQSQEAERLIVRALEGRARFDEMLGGIEVASTVSGMARAARMIQDDFHIPLNSDAGQRLWRTLGHKMLDRLFPPPPTWEQHERAMAWVKVNDLKLALRQTPDDSELANRLSEAEAALAVEDGKIAKYEADLSSKAAQLLKLMNLAD